MLEELKRIAEKYNLQFYAIWGIKGGSGWIWYKQDTEKEFRIQVFTHGNFDLYNSIKNDIISIFKSYNYTLSDEEDLGDSFGYKRNLHFTDLEFYQNQIREREAYFKKFQRPTYNVEQINADGSNIILGDSINSTLSIDSSVQVIENLIEEKGGSDKKELYATLEDAKEIIKDMSLTREIKPRESFIEKLGNHLAKHGWFYGAIVTLLGGALLIMLGLN